MNLTMEAIRPQLDDFLERLLALWPGRLLFFGLQGSWRRGEATPESDVDLVVVLDRLLPGDPARYRELAAAAPFGREACGFLCGRSELEAWPRYDLLQLYQDTFALFGSLDALTGPFTAADAREAARTGAANLYHAALHSYLYDPAHAKAAALPVLLKSMFFVLRSAQFARSGRCAPSKAALLSELAGEERELLSASLQPAPLPKDGGGTDPLLLGLVQQCSLLLNEFGPR